MEKIFTYKEPKILYSKGKLRFIVYNILELLPQFNETNCIILFNNNHLCTTNQYYIGDTLDNTIELNFDPNIHDLDDDTIMTLISIGFYNYAETLLISEMDIDIAAFIFCILHELGHSIIQRCIQSYLDYGMLSSINIAYRDVLNGLMDKSRPEDAELNSNMSYAFSPLELHATLYAYRYFQYIWNILKQRGLI